MLSVIGTHNTVGNGVWRFAESTDNTRSWRISDVRLPVGKPPWGYSDHGEDHAVGPGHLQALAWTDAPTELYLPEFLRDLWRTDDEKTFRRVPLPWKRLPAGGMSFSGMAFASDGALLLAEATGSPPSLCPDGICHPGRIWRLPAGETEMKPLLHAPRLSGPFWRYNLLSGGGVIVARTGPRAIAVSRDSYVWTKVTPGR